MSILKRFRSSRTGQYVTPAEAKANEDTTVSETHNTANTVRIPGEAVVALMHCLQRNGLEGTLERLGD
jgi:hypothetical protein